MDFVIAAILSTLLSTAPLLGCAGFHAASAPLQLDSYSILFTSIDSCPNDSLPASSKNEIVKEPFSKAEGDNELLVDSTMDPSNCDPRSPSRRPVSRVPAIVAGGESVFSSRIPARL